MKIKKNIILLAVIIPIIAIHLVCCNILFAKETAIESHGVKEESLSVAPDYIFADFHEDNNSKQEIYDSGMNPLVYRQAFKETGIEESLSTRNAVSRGSTDDGSTWILRGPVGNFGLRNGRVAGINIISTGQDTYRVYVGASTGGIWWSDSQALGSWTSIGDRLPNPAVRAFAVDPNDPRHIIVGTGDPERWKGAGMYVTHNEGGTWFDVNLPVVPERFYRLFFVPSITNRLIAASNEGILLSVDTGSTWTVVQTGDITDLVIDPTNGAWMYAARRGDGLYRSLDFGSTWVKITDLDLPAGGDWKRAFLAISNSNHNTLYTVVEKDSTIFGVYRTTNGWATSPDWTDRTGTLHNFGDQAGHALSIAVRPDNEHQIFVADSNLASSDTGGSVWKTELSETGIDPGHPDITNLYFSEVTGSDTLWITNDGGIYKHDFSDGNTTSLNGNSLHGLAISQINNIDADRNMRVAGLQDNGTIRSVDSGQIWDFIASGDGFNVEITDPEAQNFWYTDGVYGAPYLSHAFRRNYGNSSEHVHDLASNLSLVYNRDNNIIYSHNGQGIVSRSESGSVNEPWDIEVDQLQTDPYSIRNIKGSPVDGNTLIVVYNAPNRRDVTILRKEGGQWSKIHRENFVNAPSLGTVHANPCIVSPQWANEFWVILEGPPGTPKILHTIDDGFNWTDLSGNLDSVEQVRSLVVTPFNPLILYAGTDLGIFRSVNGGTTWEPFMEGLPVVPVWNLEFVVDDQHSGNHKLVAGTNGRGFWEYTVQSPPILYVDQTDTGTQQDGTFEHPFHAVADAVAAAPVNSIIAIHTGVYAEPQLINKNVTLVTYGGISTIR